MILELDLVLMEKGTSLRVWGSILLFLSSFVFVVLNINDHLIRTILVVLMLCLFVAVSIRKVKKIGAISLSKDFIIIKINDDLIEEVYEIEKLQGFRISYNDPSQERFSVWGGTQRSGLGNFLVLIVDSQLKKKFEMILDTPSKTTKLEAIVNEWYKKYPTKFYS